MLFSVTNGGGRFFQPTPPTISHTQVITIHLWLRHSDDVNGVGLIMNSSCRIQSFALSVTSYVLGTEREWNGDPLRCLDGDELGTMFRNSSV